MELKNPRGKKVQLEDEVEFFTKETVVINDPYNTEEVQEPDIFYFTNSSDEDFTTQWNKVEYTFPAMRTVRLYIKGESPEGVQSIRKMFAYRFAQREFFKSSEFKRLDGMRSNGMVTTYNEKLLQPFIDTCLKPLAKEKLKITEVNDNVDGNFKATKAIGENTNLSEAFKDTPIESIGQR